MEEKMLREYRSKLIAEAVIKSILFGLATGFFISLIIALVSYLTYFMYGFIIAFAALPVSTAAATLILYFTVFSKSLKHVAARVDRIGLEERVITAAEFAGSNSYIIQKLKLDTEERLRRVTPKAMKFKFPKWIFIVLAVVFVASAVFMSLSTVRGVYAMNKLATPVGFRYNAEAEVVTWQRVLSANSGYHIVITGDSGTHADSDVSAARADVSELEPGRYTITVFANKSGNRSQSDVSRPFIFTVRTDEEKVLDEIIQNLLASLRAEIAKSDAEEAIKTALYVSVDSLEISVAESDIVLDIVAKINATAEEIRVILNGAQVATITFSSNNGRNENVTLRRKAAENNLNGKLQGVVDGALSELGYPRSEEIFKSGDIPGAPATAPKDSVFMGWALNGSETILKNKEIIQAVADGEYSFSAVWLTEAEIIQRLLSELRIIINGAKIYEDQRAALHAIVDVLEGRLNSLSLLSEKISEIGAAKTEILALIESFKITVTFDPANGVDEIITINRLPLEFNEKNIPKKPKTPPEEGMVFAGWTVNDGAEEPVALENSQVVQAILDGAREFIAIWFYPPPDYVEPEDSDPTEPDDSDEPLESDISGIIDPTLDALDELDQNQSDDGGSTTPPGENEYRGDEVLHDGTVKPYTEVEGWYEEVMELLASGKYPPELREILERYFDALK